MENISVNEISVYTFFEFKKTESAGNFITNSRVYSLLITQAKMQTEINNNYGTPFMTKRLYANMKKNTNILIRK